jgi:hypothetical protein
VLGRLLNCLHDLPPQPLPEFWTTAFMRSGTVETALLVCVLDIYLHVRFNSGSAFESAPFDIGRIMSRNLEKSLLGIYIQGQNSAYALNKYGGVMVAGSLLH